MTRLNQVIAVEPSVKSRTDAAVTQAYHTLQKTPLLGGITRTYRPKDEDGDLLPPESTQVQVRVNDVLTDIAKAFTEMFDLTATKDYANATAKANVVVDGVVLVENAPVTYLLFLEKQLVHIHTIVNKLPVLDPSEKWDYDSHSDAYATEPVETTRSKKIPRNHIKAWPTKDHPNIVPQVETFTEDVVVGFWKTVKFSGALPQKRVNELLERVVTLQKAVKHARELANITEVQDKRVGDAVFGYLFA
jgi:hypothetical protein